MTDIFIDGEAGTTGLQIRERLQTLSHVRLLSIDPAQRKNPDAKKQLLTQADAVVLCLHDDAARDTVALIDALSAAGHKAPRIVDASTAHRTAAGWVYGFPELCAAQLALIKNASRVANPGCYATGAIALLRPLIDAGLLPTDARVNLPSVSGYSGGGRTMIEDYEADRAPKFQLYGLSLQHKHLPEIMHTGLRVPPLFVPSVGNFAQGMLVQLPLHHNQLAAGTNTAGLLAALQAHYKGSEFVRVIDGGHAGMSPANLDATALANTNDLELHVFGNDSNAQTLLVARLDNLGKGASGAAVQNLGLMFGW
ncbi:N-acetyl-gamma-glutamyl-phosphate reductase [Comamonadaceae bacterium M7527]|nr:N-acetyl-gamma-glutamyl-phosphate reductase [Comamonadaceae bacterium M7527]